MLKRFRGSRPALGLAVLTLAAVGLAGCFDGGGVDVDKLLDETFSGNKDVNSGKLNISLEAKLKGVPQLSEPVSVRVSGPFQNRGKDKIPEVDLNLTASAGGQSFEAGVLSTGDEGFVSYQGTDYKVPGKQFDEFKKGFESAQKEDKDTKQPSLKALGVEPRDWLKDPTDEGTETVGGVETRHIAADVDVAKLLEGLNELIGKAGRLGVSKEQRKQLPDEIPADTRKQLQDSVSEAKFDVFTNEDDKILRKLQVRVVFKVPEDLRAQAQGLESGSLELSVEVSDLNKPQTIKAPKNAKPLKKLQEQLGALGALGGLGGGLTPPTLPDAGAGTGSGGGAGTGSGADADSDTGDGSGGDSGAPAPGGDGQIDAERARDYLKCVEKAKQPEDLQKCAEKLSK